MAGQVRKQCCEECGIAIELLQIDDDGISDGCELHDLGDPDEDSMDIYDKSEKG